jgi:hypothetical protein
MISRSGRAELNPWSRAGSLKVVAPFGWQFASGLAGGLCQCRQARARRRRGVHRLLLDGAFQVGVPFRQVFGGDSIDVGVAIIGPVDVDLSKMIGAHVETHHVAHPVARDVPLPGAAGGGFAGHGP